MERSRCPELKQLNVHSYDGSLWWLAGLPGVSWSIPLNVEAGEEHACVQWKTNVQMVEPVVIFPLSTGRASLHGKASLQIDPVRSEDQGWYECRVLMLEQQYDTFHNGSWVHLTVNGESAAGSSSLTRELMCLWA